MDEAVLLHERRQDGVLLLTLNRPQARNALNMALRQALAAACREAGEDPGIRVLVITGDDKAFAAGADLQEALQAGPVEMMLRNSQALWASIAGCPKPIIAAVNGFALGGGCELAMHADIIIAGEGAVFGQPEARVGIMPGAGGTQRLVRAVGKYKAMKYLLTGERFGAREAEAMGLVSEVVPDAETLPRALAMAATIAAMPPLAIRQIKEVVLAGMDADLASALMLEQKAYQLLFASEDKGEGMRAFFEKRKAEFKGR